MDEYVCSLYRYYLKNISFSGPWNQWGACGIGTIQGWVNDDFSLTCSEMFSTRDVRSVEAISKLVVMCPLVDHVIWSVIYHLSLSVFTLCVSWLLKVAGFYCKYTRRTFACDHGFVAWNVSLSLSKSMWKCMCDRLHSKAIRLHLQIVWNSDLNQTSHHWAIDLPFHVNLRFRHGFDCVHLHLCCV